MRFIGGFSLLAGLIVLFIVSFNQQQSVTKLISDNESTLEGVSSTASKGKVFSAVRDEINGMVGETRASSISQLKKAIEFSQNKVPINKPLSKGGIAPYIGAGGAVMGACAQTNVGFYCAATKVAGHKIASAEKASLKKAQLAATNLAVQGQSNSTSAPESDAGSGVGAVQDAKNRLEDAQQ